MSQNPRKDYVDILNSIEKYFIGTEAKLFLYSPGFDSLYILFAIECHLFILKFMHSHYVNVKQNWVFQGFKKEYIKNDRCFGTDYYSFKDNAVEISSVLFGLYEMTEDGENKIINAIADRYKTREDRGHLSLPNQLQIVTTCLELPFLTNAIVHRYDRWEAILFLELHYPSSSDRDYLVLYQTKELEFYPSTGFKLSETTIVKEDNIIHMQENNNLFSAKFQFIDKWTREQFFNYDLGLYEILGRNKGSGRRKLVQSVEEFEQILFT